MLHIGLTGGIGSGKSTVARYFGEFGAYVMDADQIVRGLLSKTGKAVDPIRNEFGDEILAPDGSVDRKRLAAIVFSEPEARSRLESIIHPLVIEYRRRKIEELASKQPGYKIVITEASLIFEAGTGGEFDRIVLVTAPVEIRRERLLKAGWKLSEIEARMNAQWPDERKLPLADFIIENNEGPELLQRNTREIWEKLLIG